MCVAEHSNLQGGPLVSLISEMERGIEIIDRLDDLEFARPVGGQSPIGAHFRHNLDFVNALLNGVAERRIDYTDRPRDRRIETDRDHARREMRFACDRLRAIGSRTLNALVVVKSEVGEDVWHTSSVSREIEFLHSHTIHHYALVSKLMTTCHDENFGLAPSTRRFQELQTH